MENRYCCCNMRCNFAVLLLTVIVISVMNQRQWQVKYRNLVPETSSYKYMLWDGYNKKSNVDVHIDFYGYSGSTELEQYSEFRKRNPKFVMNITGKPHFVKPPSGYSITAYVICGETVPVAYYSRYVSTAKENTYSTLINKGRKVNVEGVFLGINERLNGNHENKGGSSFRIISTTVMSRQMCSYVDMFDGTYVAWCPLSLDWSCSDLSVSLDFFNFSAYNGHHKPLRDVRWSHRICREQQIPCSDEDDTYTTFSRRTNLARLQYETAKRNVVTWQRLTDGWRARMSSIDQVFDRNRTRLCERLKRLGRVILIGASHMRYKSDHLVIQCYTMSREVARKHSSMVVGNVEYIKHHYAKDFMSVPSDLVKKNLTKRDLVLVQTGAYDMFSKGLQNSFAVAVPVFSQVLRKIHNTSRRRGFRVVFVTSPSYPRSDSRLARGSRNNFALAAFNGSMKKAMVHIGVDIFDEFSAFLSYEEEAICGAHYVCRLIGDTQHMTGELGKSAAELLLAYASS